MIAKSDLEAVLDEMRAEVQRASVEPPAVEEMLAYRRGELSPDDEARVRELLICYPELLRALMTPLPDDADLPQEKIDAQWAAMRAHVRAQGGGRVVEFRTWFGSVAATFAIVFGTLYCHAWVDRRQPRALAIEAERLQPGNSRGPSHTAQTVTPQGDYFVLVPAIYDQRQFDRYRVEIRDPARNRSLWSTDVPRTEETTVVVLVPRSFLDHRRYTMILYGSAAGREDLIDTYDFSVQQ